MCNNNLITRKTMDLCFISSMLNCHRKMGLSLILIQGHLLTQTLTHTLNAMRFDEGQTSIHSCNPPPGH